MEEFVKSSSKKGISLTYELIIKICYSYPELAL